MNPFLIEVLAMLFRQGMIYLAGVLGVSAFAASHMTQIQQYSVSGAVFALTVGYAFYKKYFHKQLLVTALNVANLSEREVKALVKDRNTPTPSVKSSKSKVPQ